MDNYDYYDDTFYLRLTRTNNATFIRQVKLTWNVDTGTVLETLISGPFPVGEINTPECLSATNPGNLVPHKCLIDFGKNIAELLLPNDIRTNFINLWNFGEKKIRICLLYPNEENQRSILLEIPWEYIYLSKDDTPDLNYLLGIRHDISIVHCLNPDKQPDPRPSNTSSISELKVKMKYLSGLSQKDRKIDKNLFNDFAEELPLLEPVIDCTNITGTNPEHFEGNTIEGEPPDVTIAFKDHDLLHVVSHGDINKILLKENESLTTHAIDAFVDGDPKARQIKVVVLLTCDSAAALSVARQLHQDKQIPIVIGITRSMPFSLAGKFTDGFYKAIAAWPHHGLEKAMVEGRKSVLRSDGKGNWERGFGIARFFLNSPHSTLIPEHTLYANNQMKKYFDEEVIAGLIKGAEPKYLSELKKWVIPKEGESVRSWYLFTGEPGKGKSTQIALLINDLKNGNSDEHNLTTSGNPKLIYHFCLGHYPDTVDPLVFVRNSLVPQLNDYFTKSYFKALNEAYVSKIGENLPEDFELPQSYYGWCRQGKFPLLVNNAEDALNYFVLEPLRKIKEMNEILKEESNNGYVSPIIVIDGIDLIPPGQSRNNSILGLLLHYRDELDNFARFLITADVREDDNLDTLQEKLIREDIHHLTNHLYEPADLVIESDTSPSRVPLLLKMKKRLHLFDIITLEISDDTPNTTDEINDNSKQHLDALLNEALGNVELMVRDRNYADKVRLLLDVAAVAYEPLSPYDAAAIIGLNIKSNEIDEVLALLKPFFRDLEPDRELQNIFRQHFEEKNIDYAELHELLDSAVKDDNTEDKLGKVLDEYFRIYGIAPPDELENLKSEIREYFNHHSPNHSRKLTLYHHSIKKYLLNAVRTQRREATIHELFVHAVYSTSEEHSWANIAWDTLCNTKWQERCMPDDCKDQANNDSRLDVSEPDSLYSKWWLRLISFANSLRPQHDRIEVSTENNISSTMVQYVWQYLAQHAFESYQSTQWSVRGNLKFRQNRADDFLNLICDPDFRTIRLTNVGQNAALKDVWHGLQVVYTQYALSPVYSDKQAADAFTRLVDASARDSLIRDDLFELERRIRVNNGGVRALFEFLELEGR